MNEIQVISCRTRPVRKDQILVVAELAQGIADGKRFLFHERTLDGSKSRSIPVRAVGGIQTSEDGRRFVEVRFTNGPLSKLYLDDYCVVPFRNKTWSKNKWLEWL